MMLFGSVRAREMANELSGKLVNVAAFEVVELLSLGIEDSRTNDDRYEGATTIEYIAIHDRPPIEVPHYGKGCAYWVTIARRIALSAISPSPSAPSRQAAPPGSKTPKC